MKNFKEFLAEEGEPTNVSGQNDSPDLPLGKKKKKKKEEVDEEREPDQTNPKMKGKRNPKMKGDNPNSEGDDVKRDDNDEEEKEVKESKTPKIDVNKTYKYFEMFLKREGWSDEDIKWESNFFRDNLKISPEMHEREIKDLYFTSIRRGSKKRLNRKDKIGLVLTFSNAANHASVG